MARSRATIASRFVEPSHMGIAGGERAVRLREAWIVLDGQEQLRRRLVEATSEEMAVPIMA